MESPARTRGNGRLHLYGFVLGVLGPFMLAAALLATPDLHALPSEAMLFTALVVAIAITGGLIPAITAALVSGFTLNYFFTPPLRDFAIASGENAFALVLFMVVAVAVSSVVDLAARRTAQAEKASAEADALTVLSHSLLHAGDFSTLLGNACELFGMRGAAIMNATGGTIEAFGEPIDQLGTADVVVPIDDQTSLALIGRPSGAADQRLLQAYAAHASVLAERRVAAQEGVERRLLAETDRTRTALLGAVSHDLRTPLATVKAAVGSLRNTEITWSPADEQMLLAAAEEGTDRLEELIANLLDMSRIHMRAVTAHADLVELEAVVAASVATLAGRDRVAVVIAPEAALVIADAGLLERVLANLVGNALAYAPAPSAVLIDAGAVGGRVVVRVVDRGPGVRGDQRSDLFEPFQRLDDVPRGEGVGLGLAVARGLTEAMGGTLTAEDTPGGGLTFVLELPMPDDAV